MTICTWGRGADVAWASDEFIARFGYETPYPKAPEICVEITSPSNAPAEIEHKIELHLATGAVRLPCLLGDGVGERV